MGFLAAGREGNASAPLARLTEDCERLGAGLTRAELPTELEGCDLGGASQLGVGAGAAEPLPLDGRAGKRGVFPGTGGLLLAAQLAWWPTDPLELCAVELLSLSTLEVPTRPPRSPTADDELSPAGAGRDG